MPDVPVTLVPWFDAKDNPPEHDRVVVTDIGAARYRKGYRVPGEAYAWFDHDAGMADWSMDPRPSVWCDPSPPDGDDPLTVEDLHAIVLHCYNGLPRGEAFEVFPAAARLRRALDAI